MVEAGLALRLADLHHELLGIEDAATTIDVSRSTADEDDFMQLIAGGGFELTGTSDNGGATVEIQLRRIATLPDWVDSAMDLLVCGLNPSPYSVETGVGFGRPGNRFWPAAIAAELVSVDRDPRHALVAHRVGMTDLAKRPTRRADELSRPEYKSGLKRVEGICDRYRPKVLCVVGLAGWRAAVDRSASVGLQETCLGPTQVFLMGSTSGLNAHATVAGLTEDLARARQLARDLE